VKIVIIGAGIVGSSIGYHLACRGAEVILVEKDQPGSGASRASFAWLNAGTKEPFEYHDLNRRSLEMWERFTQKLGQDVGLRWGGKVSWEAEPDLAEELRRRIKILQGWGYPIREIASETLSKMVPGLKPGPVSVAEYSEIEGHVEPLRVIQACVQKVIDCGSSLLTNTSVLGLEKDRHGKVKHVITTSGEITCDVVVVAAGVNTSHVARMGGTQIPQQQSPGVVIKTDSQPPLLNKVPVVYMPQISPSEHKVHIRQLMDGSFMIGEGSQESLSRNNSPEHARELLRRAAHYFPDLCNAQGMAEPIAYRPIALDGYPVIGWTVESPNTYIALTHSGVTLAPLIGQVASMEILDQANIRLISSYRPSRKFILTNTNNYQRYINITPPKN
jgi:glycine/D-amino acid oxidase-like deaminating enzyme